MRCPLCGVDVELPPAIAGMTICPACSHTLTASGQVATSAQTVKLPAEAIAALRKLRTQTRRIRG